MNDPRFAELLERYFDRELGAEEKAEFQSLLLAGAEARERFWRETEWRARLHQWGAEQAGRAEAREKIVAMPATQSRPALRRVLALAAAAMLCALGAWVWEKNRVVAEVAAVAGAEWKAGGALRRGPVKLAGGVVELVFKSGARVVVVGPADLEITGGNSLRLHSGRLSATVPVSARGFTVETRDAKVVDLGTRFGVAAGAASRVDVFEGTVDVRAAAQSARLAAGEAVTTSDGNLMRGVADAAAYAGAAILERRESARRAGAALSAHPAALVHLEFEQHAAARNLARSDVAVDVGGGAAAEGRMPGMSALVFSKADDRVRLTVPGELHALTLLAWVRVDDNAQTQSALMMSGAELPGDVHWFLHRDNKLGFSVIGADGQWHTAWGRLPPAKDWLGKWVFLATTFDGSTVTHYFDGKLIGAARLDGAGLPRPGAVELGNWAVRPGDPLRASRNVLKEPAGYARNLRGSLDEFTLLSTALAADEIQRLYEQGRASSATARTFSK